LGTDLFQDRDLATSFQWALDEIRKIQKAARSGKPIMKPRVSDVHLQSNLPIRICFYCSLINMIKVKRLFQRERETPEGYLSYRDYFLVKCLNYSVEITRKKYSP
jgi:hypothetical protein